MDDFKEFVARRLAADEREPFCPFNGPDKIGYCNIAYSDHCYHCDESWGEWEEAGGTRHES